MIRVERNAAGNCLVFHGQTNPVYFNACLSAVVDGDTVSVRNDIASAATETQDNETWEYYKIHYTEWQNGEFESFASAQEVADYINSIGNVTDVPTGGYTFGPADTLDFTRDETLTSILFSNGDHHGINAVKAVAKENGRVGLISAVGEFEFYELDFENCSIDGVSAGNTLNTVVNNLNAFFTLTVVGAGLDPKPVYTQADGEDEEWNEEETQTPIGGATDTDFGYGSTNSAYHGPRVWTTETIDEPGEYFTLEIENSVAGSGPLFGLGLYSVTDGDLVEIEDNSLSNSGHHGYWFSNWFYNYNGYTAPWTTYGSKSSLSYGAGWNGSTSSQFRYSDAHDAMRGGGTALFKVGITDNGFCGVWYYDVNRTNDWILCARSSTPMPAGEYGLLCKIASSSCIVRSKPRRFATDPAAPTLYYRYIESPDGSFDYPLFASEEEANYVSSDGTSHTHTYVDDPSGTTWYMPNVGGTMAGSSAPTGSEYTEITTLDDASFAPPSFTQADLTIQEGNNVNIQVSPAGASWTTSVSGLPAGLVYDGYSLVQGTAPEVTSDTVYTITVTRANSYGSSTGSFDLTVTDVAPPQTNDTSWTKALDFSGSSERTQMVSTGSLFNPMMMAGTSSTTSAPGTAGNTVSFGHPWATSVVFKYDGNNSNQHIWNLGEGVGADNIYLRMSANGYLYFGWGRDGDGINECSLGGSLDTSKWFGLYVGFNGTRHNSANATAANLADCFDIRLMRLNDAGTAWTIKTGTLTDAEGNRSIESNWTQTGYRMDRATTGALTLGGRGANRSFNGKIASFVTTTLRLNDAMPSTAEIETMITDPQSWIDDYKVGNDYRVSSGTQNFSNFQRITTHGNGTYTAGATQVWLMGDGMMDSYSNMIRNQVQPLDQNNTKMNMVSMTSNDIQTVNIPGLT